MGFHQYLYKSSKFCELDSLIYDLQKYYDLHGDYDNDSMDKIKEFLSVHSILISEIGSNESCREVYFTGFLSYSEESYKLIAFHDSFYYYEDSSKIEYPSLKNGEFYIYTMSY